MTGSLPAQEGGADSLIDLRPAASVNYSAPASNNSDRWMEIVVPLHTRGASSQNNIDNIRVVLSLATESGPAAGAVRRYYRSEVEIATLRGAQSHNIRFYLPGAIVERDRLSGDPYAWAVQVFVDGREQSLTPRAARSRLLQAHNLYQSFLQAVNAEARRTEGVLVPIYESPFLNNFPNEAFPSFVRRASRSG